jgi:deoxyribonuclease-4
MKIGCHLSISKGFAATAENAVRLGAESFQFFTKNPRSFSGGKPPDPVQAEKGLKICVEHGLIPLAHSPYITNLSTPKDDLQELSIRSLLLDLEIAQGYGACGLVVHMGKHVDMGVEYGMQRMVETLDRILEQWAGPMPLLLENTAGQGTELGTTLEQLLETRAATRFPEKIGFCFDTCHGFAAGMFHPDQWEDFAREMERSGYRQHLVAVHLNDSLHAHGERKDRHANLGKGHIGEAGLAAILRSEIFSGLPVVLETPVSGDDDYQPEMEFARSLRA